MRTAAVFLSGVVGISASAWCMVADYSPFRPDEKPRPFPIHQCVCLTTRQQDENRLRYEFAASVDSHPRVVLAWNSEQNWVVSLIRRDSSTLASIILDSGFAGGLNAYTADLNADNRPDFVVCTYTGGCGLAAGITYTTFFLSKEEGYAAHTILGWQAELTDFLDLNGDGKPEYVHTTFVYGEEGRDGKAHNYWVHNLLTFSGADIVSANNLDRRFPAWIWYKFKPNHENTDQLTAHQRMTLWRQTWTDYLGPDGQPLFPHPEKFAREQGKTVPRTVTDSHPRDRRTIGTDRRGG